MLSLKKGDEELAETCLKQKEAYERQLATLNEAIKLYEQMADKLKNNYSAISDLIQKFRDIIASEKILNPKERQDYTFLMQAYHELIYADTFINQQIRCLEIQNNNYTDQYARNQTKTVEELNMGEIIGKQNRQLHAVIIGISYKSVEGINTLSCPAKEAKAFHQLLCSNFSEFQDNFVLMTDDDNNGLYAPTLKNIKRELGDELPRRSKENDFVIIYFSGHGTPEFRGGQQLPSKYLVPVDVDTHSVYSSCYSLDSDLINLINSRDFKAAGVWIILDCCFSGGVGGKTFKGPQFNSTKWLSQKFTEINLGSGWQILSACEDNEVALEGKQYSVLTHAVIETLTGDISHTNIIIDNNIKVMTLNAIHDAIIRKVRKLNPKQHPVVMGRNRDLKFPMLIYKDKSTEFSDANKELAKESINST